MKRDPVDKRLSTKSQEMTVLLYDLAEAIEDVFEDVHYLEALAKPQAGADVVEEVLSREYYHTAQERTLAKLREARAILVGSQRSLAAITGRKKDGA